MFHHNSFMPEISVSYNKSIYELNSKALTTIALCQKSTRKILSLSML